MKTIKTTLTILTTLPIGNHINHNDHKNYLTILKQPGFKIRLLNVELAFLSQFQITY
jgi:hypothetical protein